MNHRGRLIVIPDEAKILQEIFERQIKQGESHTKYLQEFSDIFELGYHFKEDDYQEAPCAIANSGHMVIKIEEDVSLVICYLPKRITDRQYLYLHGHQTEFSQYGKINAYSLKTEEEEEWDSVHGMGEIIQEATRKNLLRLSKNEGKNVR